LSGKQKYKKHTPPIAVKQPKLNPAAVNTIPSYIYWAGLGAVLLFSVYIRSNFLEIPFERDEGAYTYTGKIILNGAIPFKEIGSQRLPGVFYAYAIMVWIFGYTLQAMHIGFIVINLITTVILFLIGKELFDKLTALVIAASFALLSMIPHAYGFTTQSEHLVAITGFAGILFLLKFFKNEKWYYLVVSGVLLSLAFQIKQTSMFYCMFTAVIFIYHYFKTKPVDWKLFFKNGFIFFGSFLLPVLFSLFVIWYQDAWADFKIWIIDVSKTYTSVITFSDGLTLLQDEMVLITKGYAILWFLSFAALILIFYSKTTTFNKIFIVGLYFFCFITVVPGNHYYGHYFLQFIPAVAIAVGASVFSMRRIMEQKVKLRPIATIASLLIFIFAAGNNISKQREYYFKPNYFKLLRTVYGINPFPEAKIIADKLNAVLKPEDKIAIMGTEIELYVYTNKFSPSRFSGSGALVEFPVAQSQDWQREFMGDVEKAAPRFLIFFANRYSWMQHPKAVNLIEPWFNKYVNEKYNLYGFADMYSDQTRYFWTPNIDMQNDPPRSEYKVYIFERKPTVQ